MKLFLWDGCQKEHQLFTDWQPGGAFAIAETPDQARHAVYEKWRSRYDYLSNVSYETFIDTEDGITEEPQVFDLDEPRGFLWDGSS